ncbi:hypothetical protein GCU68_18265 (plasmid) [Natronorubrum aibiense]|uniref:Uncharacterized protein n=1 Tax=Natronorubrum aibiense TaxID=348826 RepID=A0A5P9P8L8_9EURY|nr:hypothetical protein GCU68_18265 [Natronorubrum aibiense]
MDGMKTFATIIKYSAGGTLGSLFIAYGLREFLRASGGGYYCCRHSLYQTQGISLTFIGWVIILVTLINLYGEMR